MLNWMVRIGKLALVLVVILLGAEALSSPSPGQVRKRVLALLPQAEFEMEHAA